MTSQQLAAASGTTERCVREWLSAQAASGYVEYEPATAKFSMLPEQAMVFADEDSPYFMGAVGDMMSALMLDEPKISEPSGPARASAGMSARSACSVAPRASSAPPTSISWCRSGCRRSMMWSGKLERGAKVADIGCGHGISTILMAKAFPDSRFFGFDAHPGSIDTARGSAMREGLRERSHSTSRRRKRCRPTAMIWFCFFDCLHDMGDPVGALRHVRETMADDGTCMLGRTVCQRPA